MKKIIEVQNLIKRYKKADKNAVDDISFDVAEGEFFAFLGPNGAGKTTTISILTTTLSKTSGTVRVNGFDLEKEASQVRGSIGVIFQKPSLDLNLTAEENVRLHTILYKIYPFSPSFSLMPEDYKKRIYELAEVLDIKNEIFKPINTFSGGMKRKLEIIRTLMHKPKVLFLDEPTSGLDPVSRKNLWHYLEDVRKKEKTTIFLTTHYLDEAEGADRICVVNNGKIIVNSTIQELKEKLVKEYLILDTLDKDNLKKELNDLGHTFEEIDGYRINIKGKSVQEIIKTIDTKLTNIKIVQPTLEEAYIDLIGGNHG